MTRPLNFHVLLLHKATCSLTEFVTGFSAVGIGAFETTFMANNILITCQSKVYITIFLVECLSVVYCQPFLPEKSSENQIIYLSQR